MITRKLLYKTGTLILFLLLHSGTGLLAQNGSGQIKISGIIRNKLNEVMKGATVQNLNTNQSVLSGANGQYVIAASKGDSLVASFVGYTPFRWAFTDRIDYDITLETVAGSLNEVVVVGYGRQRKISQIGSQAILNTQDLKQPIANVGAGLAGRLAGLVSVQRTGEPGHDDADIWIRGIATMNNSRPLILVDGIERSLSNLNYEDIASLSILKDASATAVYGVRGANGVVLITTKRGKPGKPEFSFDYMQSVTTFTKMPKMADGKTYMEMANEALVTRGDAPKYSDEYIANTLAGNDPYLYPNVNWIDEVFKNRGSNRKATLNINGGAPSAFYYVSLGYYDEKGFLKSDP
ncbi:MAG TPA: TonB-dependent receptor plug domain-containing protein, partial [Flavisolibacter sp.]|nr:TonB-dependent receptor plug domain-containing protein [Flavisolibacter sp.]